MVQELSQAPGSRAVVSDAPRVQLVTDPVISHRLVTEVLHEQLQEVLQPFNAAAAARAGDGGAKAAGDVVQGQQEQEQQVGHVAGAQVAMQQEAHGQGGPASGGADSASGNVTAVGGKLVSSEVTVTTQHQVHQATGDAANASHLAMEVVQPVEHDTSAGVEHLQASNMPAATPSAPQQQHQQVVVSDGIPTSGVMAVSAATQTSRQASGSGAAPAQPAATMPPATQTAGGVPAQGVLTALATQHAAVDSGL